MSVSRIFQVAQRLACSIQSPTNLLPSSNTRQNIGKKKEEEKTELGRNKDVKQKDY
jgi:hypothetical protein